jgi:hypothetical protein
VFPTPEQPLDVWFVDHIEFFEEDGGTISVIGGINFSEQHLVTNNSRFVLEANRLDW